MPSDDCSTCEGRGVVYALDGQELPCPDCADAEDNDPYSDEGADHTMDDYA